ncbi:zinc ABC transporter substrate-binding protein [Sneathiella aquimaris]|uniref:zinc ABC transporter substrate-binding protein n=1 Tax=Sneathiella aquimaris TaxID=2599305 RepID=UPI001469ED0B|nr:zinc ABC transporter substrate-binding protein [Sneathiella aquimaris]
MKKYVLAVAVACAPFSLSFAAETKGVMTTIAPLHSLVQGVMGETGEAELLIQGYASPHNYQLKPSQIRKLQKSNFVFYIGGGFEGFLSKTLETLPSHIRKISMANKARLEVLENRAGGAWEAHAHSGHAHEGDEHDSEHGQEHEHEHQKDEGHDHEKDHAKNHGHDKKHADEEDHKHAGEVEHKDEHEHEHEHEHGSSDGHDADMHSTSDDHHFWLDPDNAVEIVKTITRELSVVYPENQDLYKRNAKAMIARIRATDQQLAKELEAIKDIPYIVFHDAYQYFEKHYELTAVGSILLEPDEKPGVGRIREIRRKLIDSKAVCIFREPQFSDKLVKTVLEGTEAKSGTLDPIGSEIAVGENQYTDLLKSLSRGLQDCLKSQK